MQKIYCPIRKVHVAAQPEEKVRQQLIMQMVTTLGFPLSLLAVEKSLKQMPHLETPSHQIPNRRADLVCFAQGIHASHALYPLLLVECKAIPLSAAVMQQAVSYNQFLRAYFIAIANETEIQTGWYNIQKKQYQFTTGMPPYSTLLDAVQLPH